MWNPMRRTEATGGLVDIIHDVRRRWRYKLALRGAVGVLGARRRRAAAVGLRAGVVALQRRLDRHVPRRAGPDARCAGRLVPRPAAAAARLRRAGGAVSRGARAVAAGGDHQRRRDERRSNSASTAESPHSAALVERLVESAVEKCQAIDSGRAVERRPVRRYAGTIAAIAVVDAGGVLARPGLPAARAVGAADRVAQRRGGGAVPDRGDARQCDRAAQASTRRSRRSSKASTPSRPR